MLLAVGANTWHVALALRRPTRYLAAAAWYNQVVWLASVAAVLGPHVEAWLAEQDPEVGVGQGDDRALVGVWRLRCRAPGHAVRMGGTKRRNGAHVHVTVTRVTV